MNSCTDIMAELGNLELQRIIDHVLVNGESWWRDNEPKSLKRELGALISDVEIALMQVRAAERIAVLASEKLLWSSG